MAGKNIVEDPRIYPDISSAITAARKLKEAVLFRDPVTGDDKPHSLEFDEEGRIVIPGLQAKPGQVFSAGNQQLPEPHLVIKPPKP